MFFRQHQAVVSGWQSLMIATPTTTRRGSLPFRFFGKKNLTFHLSGETHFNLSVVHTPGLFVIIRLRFCFFVL